MILFFNLIKRRTFYLCLFVFQGVMAFSQPFPFLTDYPSLGGSVANLGSYSIMAPEQKKLTTAVNRFSTDFAKRTVYLTTSFMLASEISMEVNKVITRYNTLKNRNDKLSLFSYSTKKENKKMLETIQKILRNLKSQVDKQSYVNVLLGEKINLYTNTMKALSEIQLLMDVVEDGIDNTTFYRRYIEPK